MTGRLSPSLADYIPIIYQQTLGKSLGMSIFVIMCTRYEYRYVDTNSEDFMT